MTRRDISPQQSDKLLAHVSAWLAGALGLAASFMTLLAIFAFLYFILATAGLFQLLAEWAQRSVKGEAAYGMGLWRALAAILLQSTLNILTSLWSVRWGFLGFGALGCLAGLTTRRIVRLDPRLGGVGSFLFFFLSSLYLVVPGTLYLSGGAEAFVDIKGVSQIIPSSPLTGLFVGLLFGLVIGSLIWELWRLGYTFLLSWMMAFSPYLQKAQQEISRQPDASRVVDEWRAYATHLRELKRDERALEQARWRRPRPGQGDAAKREPIVPDEPGPVSVTVPMEADASLPELLVRPLSRVSLPAVVILFLCLLAMRVLHPYQMEVAARTVKNWTVAVSQEKPRTTSSVEIVYRPQTLTIHKLTGGGMVTIALTGPEPSQEQVWALEWNLSERPFRREYSIAHLPPGLYQMAFQFEGEDEAGLGYTYSQGGGPLGQLLGLAAGLMLTTAFVAAGIILAAFTLRLYLALR